MPSFCRCLALWCHCWYPSSNQMVSAVDMHPISKSLHFLRIIILVLFQPAFKARSHHPCHCEMIQHPIDSQCCCHVSIKISKSLHGTIRHSFIKTRRSDTCLDSSNVKWLLNWNPLVDMTIWLLKQLVLCKGLIWCRVYCDQMAEDSRVAKVSDR